MRERDKWLQVRMTGAERAAIDNLAAAYGFDASNFVRKAIEFIVRSRPVLTAHPIVPPGQESPDDETRYLQVRMADTERDDLDDIAGEYGLDASAFIRVIMGYFRAVRPGLQLIPNLSGKALGPVGVAVPAR